MQVPSPETAIRSVTGTVCAVSGTDLVGKDSHEELPRAEHVQHLLHQILVGLLQKHRGPIKPCDKMCFVMEMFCS